MTTESLAVEVDQISRDQLHTRIVSCTLGEPYSKIWCYECGGSGRWAYGPMSEDEECVVCRGTGFRWFALW